MSEWQRGFPLDQLKKQAQPFRQWHAEHVHGAFGLVKEREIAAARAEGRLVCVGDPPSAASIWRDLKAAGRHKDFSGREWRIPKGDRFVSAIAGVPEEQVRMLRWLGVDAGHRLWVEIFEESYPSKKAVEALGLHYCFTKVMAGSEVKGVYSTHRQQAPEAAQPGDEIALSCIDPEYRLFDISLRYRRRARRLPEDGRVGGPLLVLQQAAQLVSVRSRRLRCFRSRLHHQAFGDVEGLEGREP